MGVKPHTTLIELGMHTLSFYEENLGEKVYQIDDGAAGAVVFRPPAAAIFAAMLMHDILEEVPKEKRKVMALHLEELTRHLRDHFEGKADELRILLDKIKSHFHGENPPK